VLRWVTRLVGFVALFAIVAPAAHGASYVRDRTCAVSGGGNATIAKGGRADFYASARGTISTAMLFVDFSDAPAGSLDTRQLHDLYVSRSERWFAEASYGRANLNVRPLHGWLRMPQPASSYFPPGGDRDFDRYITDVIRTADPSFDFGGVEIVYVVPAPHSGQADGPAHFGPPLRADGQELSNFVTFGDDTVRADAAEETHSELLVHETGHELSLPDYYSYDGGSDVHRYVGFWDSMGEAFLGNHFSAWSKRMLGWLRPADFLCLRSGRATITLRPLTATSGRRGVFIRLSATRAYVVEARRKQGFDSPLCAEGVVVYRLDGRLNGENGALTVRRHLADSGDTSPCNGGETVGRFDRAPFTPGSTFRDRRARVTVKVLASTASGYRIRVVKRRAG
jgi:M6 family metalloprotease-like protein